MSRAAGRIETISERCSWTVAASLINRFREALVPDRKVNSFYQMIRPVGIIQVENEFRTPSGMMAGNKVPAESKGDRFSLHLNSRPGLILPQERLNAPLSRYRPIGSGETFEFGFTPIPGELKDASFS